MNGRHGNRCNLSFQRNRAQDLALLFMSWIRKKIKRKKKDTGEKKMQVVEGKRKDK